MIRKYRGVNYSFRILTGSRGFWWHWWTPSWHNGKGPYVSIGLGLFAIYRGY